MYRGRAKPDWRYGRGLRFLCVHIVSAGFFHRKNVLEVITNINNKMIMKKRSYLYLLAIMMVAVLSVGFVSCGNDDDDDITGGSELVDKLQGTWQFQKGTETVMGMTITMDRSSLSQMKKSMEQKMGSKVEFWDETLSFSGSRVNGVSYKLDGNKLILDGMDAMEGISISVKSVTSSTLVLREEISMEGIDMTADMEYSKK